MTQAGTARRLNEDSFQLQGWIYPDTLNSREQKIDQSDDYWQIFAVTDGMGGAGVGDIASRVIQSYLMDLRSDFSLLDPYSFSFATYIQDFLTKADQGLQMRLRKQANQAVGCSLALLMMAGETCYTMAVGNCRIYLYREGYLYRMTEDHVLNDDASDRPLLFLGNHPGIHQLRAQNLKHMQVQAGDHFFLCTDGITNALDDEDIKWVLDKTSPIQTYVESLFQNARRYDARDNQTILGLKIKSRRVFTGPEASDLLYPDRNHPGTSQASSYRETGADAPQLGSQATGIYRQAGYVTDTYGPVQTYVQKRPGISSEATGIYAIAQGFHPQTPDVGRPPAAPDWSDQQQTTGSYIPLNTLTGTNRQATGVYDLPTGGLGAWEEMNRQASQREETLAQTNTPGHSLLDLLRQNLGLSVMALVLLVLVLILFIFL